MLISMLMLGLPTQSCWCRFQCWCWCLAFPDGPKMVTEPITTSGDLGDSVSSFIPNHITDMFWLTSCRSLFSNICLLRWAWSVRWILIHHQPTPGLRVILARFEKEILFVNCVSIIKHISRLLDHHRILPWSSQGGARDRLHFPAYVA